MTGNVTVSSARVMTGAFVMSSIGVNMTQGKMPVARHFEQLD
jgi:hypothetical protein